MKIKTRSVPEVGQLDVEFSIDPSVLTQGQNQQDEEFLHPAHCDLHLHASKNDIFLEGHTQTFVTTICSRCAETIEYPLNLDLFVTCAPRKRHSAEALHQDSQEGLVFFERSELDLDAIVREQILLSLPIKYLCKPDCKGLCQKCGSNLNLPSHTCMKADLEKEKR